EARTLREGGRGRGIDSSPGPAQFFVSDSCFPQTIDVVRGRAEPLGIELIIGDPRKAAFGDRVFGLLLQSPDEAGLVQDLQPAIERAQTPGVAPAVAPDLLGLT